jgi:hypothetical protein
MYSDSHHISLSFHFMPPHVKQWNYIFSSDQVGWGFSEILEEIFDRVGLCNSKALCPVARIFSTVDAGCTEILRSPPRTFTWATTTCFCIFLYSHFFRPTIFPSHSTPVTSLVKTGPLNNSGITEKLTNKQDYINRLVFKCFILDFCVAYTYA